MKDAYYFPHDSNARHDSKILAMRSVYGSEGYGWFWIIVEMLREQTDYKLSLDKYIYDALAMQMQCERNAAHKFLDDCINEFHLFTADDKYFWSDSLCRRMETYDEKSQKARQAAHVRWSKKDVEQDKQSEDLSEMRMQCERNADAMRTQCGCNASKVKKSKVNKSTSTLSHPSDATLRQLKQPKKQPTNPDVKAFIDYYHSTFLSRFGEKPVIDGGKDGMIVKRLLNTYGLARLKGLLDAFFKSDDSFIQKSGYTLGAFKSQINKLLTEETRKKSEERRYGDLRKKIAELYT